MSKRPTNPGGQTPHPPDDEVIRLFDDEPIAAAGDADSDSAASAENAEIESLLSRLPLAASGSRLDLRIHAVLNDASLSRAATETRTVANAEPVVTRSAFAVWLRRARPVALASAALLALAFGVGPILHPHKPVVGLPAGIQPVVHLTEPQPIPRELLEDSELTAQLLLQAAAGDSDASSAAAAMPVTLTPVGLQQTFERVQDDGVVMVDGKAAYQRLRRQAVRQIVVVDPQTGEHATVSIPVQELLVRRLEPF